MLCTRSFAQIACGALILILTIVPAYPQTSGKSAQELEAELAARDQAVLDLIRRVQALEAKLDALTAVKPAPSAPASAPGVVTAQAQPRTVRKAEAPEDIDDDLTRALERSLVLSGGVLLPRGQFEIEPSIQYDFNRRSGLGLVPAGIASRDVRRENYAASLSFRAGLPWNSQLELVVPYGYQKIESVTGGVSASADEWGLGDIQIGLSKQFLNEQPGRPGLLGSLTYQRSTGRSTLGLITDPTIPAPSLGSGYDSWTAGLTAVKRMDPLVFVGSLSHSFNRTVDIQGQNIDTADTNSASFRAILAASPAVSLRGGFSLARTGETKVNGVRIPSSRQTTAFLDVGGSVVLTRRVLLDVSLGAGLTEDSPDFVFGISLPIRF